jgi:hypothetical protein
LRFAFLPSVKSIASKGLQNNSELTEVFLINVETLCDFALSGCKLTQLILPKLLYVSTASFNNNPIVFFSAPQLKNFSVALFWQCPQLETVLAP